MTTKNRIKTVYIRKSTSPQRDSEQVANVSQMLADLGVFIPQDQWFYDTGSRRHAEKRKKFQELMALVKGGTVETIYVESQSRFGTGRGRKQLFSFLSELEGNKTALWDLRAKMDLTQSDLKTELLVLVNGIKSDIELNDLSYNSQRSKVNNVKNNGSWPGGSPPFGFDKVCLDASGKSLWRWHPIKSKTVGQLFYYQPDGGLLLAKDDCPSPRKSKTEVMRLAPSMDDQAVESVRLAFKWFASENISFRGVAIRWNQAGHRVYGSPLPSDTLYQWFQNPAYAGHTRLGCKEGAELYKFSAAGEIVQVATAPTKLRRKAKEEWIVKEDTHQGIIDKATWEAVQDKLNRRDRRTNYPPQNDRYYLKGLLYCGHCGGKLTPRGNRDGYVCVQYVKNGNNGIKGGCGFHCIPHEKAETALLAKITEMGIQFNHGVFHDGIPEAIEKGYEEAHGTIKQWEIVWGEALKVYAEWVKHDPRIGEVDEGALIHAVGEITGQVISFYEGQPLDIDAVRQVIRSHEDRATRAAAKKLVDIRAEHKALTRAWALASGERQQVLNTALEELEGDIKRWEVLAIPLSERLAKLDRAIKEQFRRQAELEKELPKMTNRQRAEAFRAVFQEVAFFWDEKASKYPGQKGAKRRYSKRELDLQKTKWKFSQLSDPCSCDTQLRTLLILFISPVAGQVIASL